MNTKGWWVGDHDNGGVLVAAPDPRTARRIGANEIGMAYLDVVALRVPALDGQPKGVVDWERAVRLGGAIRCPHCDWHWAATRNGRKATRCMECGTPVGVQRERPGIA